MILADLGADVIRVDRPAESGRESSFPVLHRGRRSITIALESSTGVDVALRLIDRADAVVEGFRPGVVERLGLGPETCLQRRPGLVFGRMTGWGQEGPLAREPGHDINYVAVAGALGAIGPSDGDPVVPLNLVGDMGGGGLLLALGICAALDQSRATGAGQVIDAAMIDGTAIQLSAVLGLLAQGRWSDGRRSNLLDGAAPFYRTYRCADGRHVAVGCLEPQFYAELLRVLQLADDPLFVDQYDAGAWPAMSARLEQLFAERPRDEWAAVFDGQGACVTPVLSLTEAPAHPQNAVRETYYVDERGAIQPGPAPRFLGTPSARPRLAPRIGADTNDVLAEAGFEAGEIDALRAEGAVG